MEDDGEAGDVGVACLLAYFSPELVAAEVDVIEDAGVDLGGRVFTKSCQTGAQGKGKTRERDRRR